MRPRYIACIALFAASSISALEGHNGIVFGMTRAEVEARGFVCNSGQSSNGSYSWLCGHVDLTGTAFGESTRNYRVFLGSDLRVRGVSADVVGIKSSINLLELAAKIGAIFPNEDKTQAHTDKNIFRRTFVAPDGSVINLVATYGYRNFKDEVSISFWSPSVFQKQTDAKTDRKTVAPAK